MIGLIFKGGKYCMVPGRVTKVTQSGNRLVGMHYDLPPSPDKDDARDGLLFIDLSEVTAVFNCPDDWHPAHPSRRQKGHRP